MRNERWVLTQPERKLSVLGMKHRCFAGLVASQKRTRPACFTGRLHYTCCLGVYILHRENALGLLRRCLHTFECKPADWKLQAIDRYD